MGTLGRKRSGEQGRHLAYPASSPWVFNAQGWLVMVKQLLTGVLSVLGMLQLREPRHPPPKQSLHRAVELPGQQTAPLLQPLPGKVMAQLVILR